MPADNRYFALLERVRATYPRFNVRHRDQSWLRPIFWLLALITRQNYATFTTTIFSTMYVGPLWNEKSPDEKYKTLRHEMVHVKQFHEFPLPRWLWPINHLLVAICYIAILPVFLTLRAKFEREAYTQTMLTEFELHGAFSERKMETWARWMAETFGTGVYFWMWRGNPAYAWAMDTMRKINSGQIRNDLDRVEPLAVHQGH